MSEWCGWPVVPDSTGWESAQQILTEAELSDGLPLVPPTQRRLEAMVAGKLNLTVECNPLLGPYLFDAVDKIIKKETLPKRTVVQDGIFDETQAAKELPNRKY